MPNIFYYFSFLSNPIHFHSVLFTLRTPLICIPISSIHHWLLHNRVKSAYKYQLRNFDRILETPTWTVSGCVSHSSTFCQTFFSFVCSSGNAQASKLALMMYLKAMNHITDVKDCFTYIRGVQIAKPAGISAYCSAVTHAFCKEYLYHGRLWKVHQKTMTHQVPHCSSPTS